MAFNQESEFLNLNKVYLHFEYASLTDQQMILCQVPDDKLVYEGMTQNTYLFVTEKATLIKDIDNLSLYFLHKHVHPNPSIRPAAFAAFPFQKIKDRVCYIFQKYQQQPSLLDTILEQMILPLMNAIKLYLYKNIEIQQQICQDFHSLIGIIYQLTKVRGMKYTLKYFPHEVKDLQPAISYLIKSRKETWYWESRYIIMLWLTVIILVPFDLKIIDSKNIEIWNEKEERVEEMVEILLEISKYYLKSTTKLKEASAIFLSKLFTRPDIQERKLLKTYIDYTIENLKIYSYDPNNTFFVCGLYESLYQIFRNVNRNQLLPFINDVLRQIRQQFQFQKEKQNPAKKLIKIQLLTAIGLVYLKPRVAKWAYKKHKISLKDNLKSGSKTTLVSNITGSVGEKGGDNFGNDTENELEYYRDVNKGSLEEIIDLLIEALGEKETSIREMASKGIGKISGRLSSDMIEDILDYIFNLNITPQTQHSICLTLAELIRRNLLSPKKLQSLYPFISQSLLYQKQQGGYSIGQAVRDSACYMIWAVARGYQQGGEQLGIYLMIAACFDRQVGCRRAASAAYQELVGRVGDVPNGIEILTEADYFTLGLQKNSYLNVGIFVASYEAYFKPFAENLGYQKLRHWDIEIKRIAACSLSLMCPLNPQFMAKELLPSLVNYLKDDTMAIRLGSIIGIGEILIGLSGRSHQHQIHDEMKDSVFLKSLTQNEKKLINAGEYMSKFKLRYESLRYIDNIKEIDPDVLKKLIEIVKSFINKNLLKGKVGEIFRLTLCRLLECISIVGVELDEKEVELFNGFLEDNIKNPLETILGAAVKCLKRFSLTYHTPKQGEPFPKHIESFIKSLLTNSTLPTPQSKGYTLALSSLNPSIYQHYLPSLLQIIIQNTKILKQKQDDIDRRKNTIILIGSLISSLSLNTSTITTPIIHKIFTILFSTINDYSTDKRGDIGSIVREISMKVLSKIIGQYCATEGRTVVIEVELVEKMIGAFLKQLAEKIDRIRLLAGSLIQEFFDHYYGEWKGISHGEELKAVFEQENVRKMIKVNEEEFDKILPEVMEIEVKIQENIFTDKEKENKELIYYWNLPHFVFKIIVPLLRFKEYSFAILEGLCTSTGGISESIIKYSREELKKYINQLISNKDYPPLDNLIDNSISILQKNYRNQRIVIPMYNTLDFLFQNQDILNWQGFRNYTRRLLAILIKQIGKSKMILKIASGIGLFTYLLSLGDPELNREIIPYVVKYLASDLPKVRKILADRLMLIIMSQGEGEIFKEGEAEELMVVLEENDFMDEKMERKEMEESLCRILGVEEVPK